jgi:hypothetical protein
VKAKTMEHLGIVGTEEAIADLTRTLGPAGSPSADGERTWLRSPCLGLTSMRR